MNILHICLCGQFNESMSYQDNLLTKYHSLQGHQVTIIAPTLKFDLGGKSIIDLKEESDTIINDNIRLLRIKYKYKISRKINDKLRIYQGLYSRIEHINPDFIFIHGVQFFDALEIVRYLENHPHVKAVADNHADCHNSANGFVSRNILHKILWKYTAQKLASVCQVIYGVTPNRCTFLHEMYDIPLDKIKLLPLAADNYLIETKEKSFDKEEFKHKHNISEGLRIISTGGKLDAKKNISVLLKSLDAIKTKDFVLLLFGGINDETLERDLVNYPFVKYLGWQGQEDIIDNFLASDLVCFPGTHSVLWEQSIACGVPGVFNKIEGMEHVLINENVLLVNGNNKEELYKSISTLLNDTPMYEKMKSNAKIASSSFFYSEIAKRALNCI